MVAKELVALRPDVIFAHSTPIVAALDSESRAISVCLFVSVSDPIGAGFVASLARPGGNVTGLQLSRAAWPGSGLQCSRRSRPAWSARRSGYLQARLWWFWAVGQVMRPSRAIEVVPSPFENGADIERASRHSPAAMAA